MTHVVIHSGVSDYVFKQPHMGNLFLCLLFIVLPLHVNSISLF